MPAVREKQGRAMYAASEGKSTLGIPQSVGKEFVNADTDFPATAAGIAYISENNKFLLLKRGDTGDFPGHWAFPGGRIELGESPFDAAWRELQEETGCDEPETLCSSVAITTGKFVTIVCKNREFEPRLNDESNGYAWVSIDDLPSPMHPGVLEVIGNGIFKQAIGAYHTELDIATAIRNGELSSPQQFANMWLFDIRITGTGTAYRSKIDEMVYRPPEIYMTENFVARCNGLSVIWQHPDKGALNSDEFSDRVVGSIFLPYLKYDTDEVWGIAKIYDEAAVNELLTNKMSTSPTVVFQKIDGNHTIELEDGTEVLIEGCPSLLDHVAICGLGVWDKGGTPTGVVSDSATKEDSKMDNEKEMKEKADAEEMKAKADAEKEEFSKKFDAMMSAVDSLTKEVAELKKGEPKEVVADKKADADEEEKKKEEAEAKAKADSEEIRKRIDAVAEMMPKEISDADYDAMADCQARADSVANAFGESAPRPQLGEGVLGYRKRVANKFKKYSDTLKDVEISTIDDDALFSIVEKQIYGDALKAANSPIANVGQGLRAIKTTTPAGHRITTYKGEISSWMNNFKADAFRVSGFNTGVKK